MITCTNKPCPLRYMCARGNDTQTGEFFEYKTLKGHDYQGNIRYTHGCDHFEKKKEMTLTSFDDIQDELFGKKGTVKRDEYETEYAHQLANEVYGKLEPTSLEKNAY